MIIPSDKKYTDLVLSGLGSATESLHKAKLKPVGGLRPHQLPPFQDLIDFQESSKKKLLLNAVCGIGKTFMCLYFAEILVKFGYKFYIFPYKTKEIRDRWGDELKNFPAGFRNNCQILYPGDAINHDAAVIIVLPQTARAIRIKLKRRDFIIIDEAQENLETTGGDLKKTIESIKKDKKEIKGDFTKVIGLTGTGYELMTKGSFFDRERADTGIAIYDMTYGRTKRAVLDCRVIIQYLSLELGSSYYNGDDLNTEGRKCLKKFVRSPRAKKDSLKNLLSTVSGKTLVIVPPGCPDCIVSFINMLSKSGACGKALKKDYKMGTAAAIASDTRFRNDKNIQFLVVVYMAKVGWDYDLLENVFDLSFSKNPKVIGQSACRPIRFRKDGVPKEPRYYYCADNSKKEEEAEWYLNNAVELLEEKHIKSYDGGPRKVTRVGIGIRDEKDQIDKGTIGDRYDDVVSGHSLQVIYSKYLSEVLGSRVMCALPFIELKKEVKRLGISTRKQYGKRYREIKGAPRHPDRCYGKQWEGYFDFLGVITEYFISLHKLKNEVKRLSITSEADYQKRYREIKGAPYDPKPHYKYEWGGYPDLFGNRTRNFISLHKLKNEVKRLSITSEADYRKRYKEIEGAPSNPSKVYKKDGFTWTDLFGNRTKNFIPFHKLQSEVKRLSITTIDQYRREFIKIKGAPSCPWRTYKGYTTSYKFFGKDK